MKIHLGFFVYSLSICSSSILLISSSFKFSKMLNVNSSCGPSFLSKSTNCIFPGVCVEVWDEAWISGLTSSSIPSALLPALPSFGSSTAVVSWGTSFSSFKSSTLGGSILTLCWIWSGISSSLFSFSTFYIVLSSGSPPV